MKRFGRIVLKNAAANLLRGAVTAAVALALPHFLTRALSPERFGAWSLMVQIAACASYLDFGIQTAVARHVAQLIEGRNSARLNRLFNTALALLAAAAALALIAIGILLWKLPLLFHGIPPALLQEFRIAAALLAASTCSLLPLSAYTGVLTGLHRNEYPAFAIGVGRFAGAALAIAAARASHSLIVLATCIGGANLLGGLVQAAAVHRMLDELRLRLSSVDRNMAAELARYCAGLTVWSFGAFLVNGMDLAIVGHFQFQATGYYAIATVLITCFIGFGAAIVNALMTPIASLHAHGQLDRIHASVLLATRWSVTTGILLSALVFVFGHPLLALWVGDAYARPADSILRILVVAQVIRFIAAPFCVMLVATAQQHRGIEGAAAEGIVSIVASIAGATYFGPIGVAAGTLIGTSCGFLWVLMRTMSRAQAVPFARADFLAQGVLRPLLCCLPLCACAFALSSMTLPSQIFVFLLALAATAILAARLGKLAPARLQVQN